MDGQTATLLVVVGGLAGALIGLAAVWQEVRLALRELPLHVALRRFDVYLGAAALGDAEVRCAACRLRRTCMRGLVRYESVPPQCPNRALFQHVEEHG